MPQDAGRTAADHDPVRHGLGHESSGHHHDVVPDGHAREDRALDPEEAVLAHSDPPPEVDARGQLGVTAQDAVVVDARTGVDDRVVSDVDLELFAGVPGDQLAQDAVFAGTVVGRDELRPCAQHRRDDARVSAGTDDEVLSPWPPAWTFLVTR